MEDKNEDLKQEPISSRQSGNIGVIKSVSVLEADPGPRFESNETVVTYDDESIESDTAVRHGAYDEYESRHRRNEHL